MRQWRRHRLPSTRRPCHLPVQGKKSKGIRPWWLSKGKRPALGREVHDSNPVTTEHSNFSGVGTLIKRAEERKKPELFYLGKTGVITKSLHGKEYFRETNTLKMNYS